MNSGNDFHPGSGNVQKSGSEKKGQPGQTSNERRQGGGFDVLHAVDSFWKGKNKNGTRKDWST